MSTQMARSAASDTTGMPSGIPFIIGNEAAERFSYYGMKCILVVFMTEYLMNSAGELDVMTEPEARAYYHLFGQAVYALPILGALISDGLWGKYKTILRVSIIYCLGHLVLAFDDTRMGLAIGLGLIAIGSGGIKPCVSANVGDQFGEKNRHLMSKVFSLFYFSINFGSFFATILIPVLLKRVGPQVAFGLPGALMFIATFVFWLGRNKFVNVPPGGKALIKEMFSRDGLRAISKLILLMVFLAPYYALFEQTSSAWVLQAKKMDLNFLGLELLPSQVHSANPILVMILAPLFGYAVYPFVGRFVKVTPLRKISVGFFLTALSFLVCVRVEHLIAAGERPTVWWHMLGYVIITSAEVMVSITALEFFYTQALPKMKSLIMSIKMLSYSFGNGLVVLVNVLIQNDDGTAKLQGAEYYWFFIIMMFVSSCIFIGVAMWYPVKDYIQKQEPA